ncbi:MAG: LamG domain-containing protein [Candidatus Hydrothermae bacterium]|nr:LamG domain-containing protein [Candidatus Hydrothermae bacterium]
MGRKENVFTTSLLCILSAANLFAQAPEGTPPGLVSHWSFNGSYVNSVDINGNAVPVGQPIFVQGVQGLAVRFASTGNYLIVPDTTFLSDLPLGDFSINVWFKLIMDTVSTSWGTILRKMSPGNACGGGFFYGIHYVPRNGMHQVVLGIPTCNPYGYNQRPIDLGQLTQGTWYMLTTTYSSTSGLVKTYLNGSFVGSLNYSDVQGSANSTHPLSIGHKHGDAAFPDEFPGVLDEISIFNRVLSAAEVQQLYQDVPVSEGGHKRRRKSGVRVYYYPFGEVVFSLRHPGIIRIFTLTGRKILEKSSHETRVHVKLSRPGVYVYQAGQISGKLVIPW